MGEARGDHGAQIRTRQRVRDLAEVYTHEREVTAMLDLIPDAFPLAGTKNVDITFLEPACGSGNFLEAILRRKLAGIRWSRIRAVSRYEHWLLRALASVYGVDICADNVAEARDRLIDTLRSHYYNDANTVTPTEGFASAALAIVTTNVVRADFLRDASKVEIVAYRPQRAGAFLRSWSVLDDSVNAQREPDLFTLDMQPKCDEVPVHYTALATNPEPTRAGGPFAVGKGA